MSALNLNKEKDASARVAPPAAGAAEQRGEKEVSRTAAQPPAEVQERLLRRRISPADLLRLFATLAFVFLAPALAWAARITRRLRRVAAGQSRRPAWSPPSWMRSALGALARATLGRASASLRSSATYALGAIFAGGALDEDDSSSAADPARPPPPRPPGVPPPLRSGFVAVPLTAPDEKSPPGTVINLYWELHGPAGSGNNTRGAMSARSRLRLCCWVWARITEDASSIFAPR